MTNFIGEFECKLDVKGRLMLPSGLRKQLDPAAQERFVLNRGFEKCLVLYPKNDWEYISAEVNKLNQYVKKNREFIRYFYRGASGRILIPKRLLGYAGVEKEVVLFAYSNRIEVWDAETYNNLLTDEPDEFADLAEEVMGGTKNNEGDELS